MLPIRGCHVVTLFAALTLSACENSPEVVTQADLESAETTISNSAPPLETLGDGTPLLSPVPDFVSTETRAETGIQVAYTSDDQRELVDAAFIERQWQYMQSCVGIVAPPPLVIIVDGSVQPFTATDDVLFSFDGQIDASSTGNAGSVVIQIRTADFDGSLGNPGFNLRSIMGRSLWLSAGLAERDYPFRCARTAIERIRHRKT